jgi:hypothetical protein
MLVLVYATFMYRKRVWYLEDREPSHMYADTGGPVVLTVLLLGALVAGGLLSFNTATPSLYLEIDASRMVDSSCVTRMRLPAHMKVTGLAVHAARRELYGTDDGFLFRIPLAGVQTGNILSQGLEFLPILAPTNASSGSSGRVVTGLRGCAMSSMVAYVGAVELGVARVYEVELATAKVTRVFVLKESNATALEDALEESNTENVALLTTTASWGGIDITGLVYLPKTHQLVVGNGTGNATTTVLMFNVPPPSSVQGEDEGIEEQELLLSSSFTPLQGARGLRALTVAEGQIYSIFNNPALVVVSDAGTGAPLHVMPSLDVNVDAMAIEMTEAGRHRAYVHSSETPNVLEYSLALESGSFSSCTPNYASRLQLTSTLATKVFK